MTAKKKPGTVRKKKPVKPAKKTVARNKPRKKAGSGKTKRIAKPVKKAVRKKAENKRAGAKTRSKVKQKAKTAARKKEVPSRRSKPVKRTARKRQSAVSRSMSAQGLRQEVLKRLLIQRREEIVKEAKSEIAKYIKGEANQLVETALDDGDWSVIDLSADINLRLLESHRESLLKIDESLRKLREGSYGICEDCGGEVSSERLKVMPFAIYCRDCQERREELEKATKEELPG